GCGYGPICCALADHVPQARVIGVDVNDQAIHLANLNARRFGLTDRLVAMRPEEVDPAQRFDEIWSNPPIRIGKAALHEM
ncbi:methyltransferase, partial [Escherichia coli]|uniref:methyltransferase n=1 Tax=Escherichia coli TaxID=562 RepID=UPI003896DC14